MIVIYQLVIGKVIDRHRCKSEIWDEDYANEDDAWGIVNISVQPDMETARFSKKWWLRPISHRIKDRRFLRIEEEVALN